MFPIPKRHSGSELLDLPPGAHPYDELAGNLADIRLANRYLGGTSAALECFSRLIEKHPPPDNSGPITVLDVATGSSDIPMALIDLARARGMDIHVTAVDINPAVVKLTHERAAGYPELAVEVADALALPYPPSSFDFVMCTQAAHHFPEEAVVGLVGSVSSIARRGWFICDLRRSRAAYCLTYALTRLFTRNRLTRHDAPLSVLRAYTPAEFAGLASRAGIEDAEVVEQPFWRMAIIGDGYIPPFAV